MSRPDDVVAGRYRLVTQIAAGGMGSVWEAWDERLQRRVALKQLHPQPGLSAADAQLASDRAMREARITARLHHPHAVPVYDVVDHQGMPCMVMQYLPSKSLQTLITERGVLSVPEVARIGSQVADALDAAHRAGIVHRDVKPGNVLIDEDGSAKLTDFGISHALGDASLTSTGMVTGTPAFLAPEVARGADSTAASDVFSLGSTLYAALEGVPPFGTTENPMAMLHRVASGQVVGPRRSGPLTPVLQRMLAADPAARPSMAEVSRWLAGAPAATSPTRPARSAPGPPPSATVMLPAAGPVAARSHRNGRALAVAVALAVLLVVALAVVLVTRSGSHPTAGGSTASAASRSTRSTPAPRTSSHPTSRSASSPAATSSTPSSATASGTSGSEGGTGSPTSAQLIQAVSDYYALLPDDTDTAWTRLTPEYQSGGAGGRKNYDKFWKDIDSVSVSDETVHDGLVEATLHYTSKQKVSTERRTFRLVQQDGILKIADSQVVGG